MEYLGPMANQHLPKLTVCQNCETRTTGNFCPECGQDCRDHRVGLRLLLVGLWNDLFTFDNRFWLSFLVLLFKPGELTRRYMGGKRVRYIPPARMYLFVSIIFFFVLSAVAEKEQGHTNIAGNRGGEESATVQADSTGTPDIARDGEGHSDDDTMTATIFGTRYELDEADFLRTMLSLAPKGMFLMLPIFAALLALIYVRRRRVFVEHFIFSLHFHTVVFVGFLLVLVVPWDWLILVVWAAFQVYLYLAMKRVYGQGWLKTLLKHFLLLSSYNVVLFFFLVILAVSGIWLTGWAMEHPGWGGLIS